MYLQWITKFIKQQSFLIDVCMQKKFIKNKYTLGINEYSNIIGNLILLCFTK